MSSRRCEATQDRSSWARGTGNCEPRSMDSACRRASCACTACGSAPGRSIIATRMSSSLLSSRVSAIGSTLAIICSRASAKWRRGMLPGGRLRRLPAFGPDLIADLFVNLWHAEVAGHGVDDQMGRLGWPPRPACQYDWPGWLAGRLGRGGRDRDTGSCDPRCFADRGPLTVGQRMEVASQLAAGERDGTTDHLQQLVIRHAGLVDELTQRRDDPGRLERRLGRAAPPGTVDHPDGY